MKSYNYYLYNPEDDIYGQRTLIKDASGEPAVQGTIKIAINHTSTSIQDNINYREASYMGLTMSHKVDDTYVIQYGDERLKVLYVVPKGRYRQVFMTSM